MLSFFCFVFVAHNTPRHLLSFLFASIFPPSDLHQLPNVHTISLSHPPSIQASGLHTAFPAAWWSKNEPPPQRPSSPTRRTRFASRYRPWLQHPHYHAIKAVHTPTNTLLGFAGWNSPSHMSLPESQGGFTNMFRGSTHERLGLAAPGWEESEGWRGVDVAVFEGELAFYDRVRREEVGERPHWYLAPFFVKEEFRGRGVGAVLMRWGVERADAEGCECYLEALPNARPVYLRFGFGEPVGRGEVGRDVVLIRPARAEGVVGDAKVGDGEVQV